MLSFAHNSLVTDSFPKGGKTGLSRATVLDLHRSCLWLLGVPQQGSLQAHVARGPQGKDDWLSTPQECKVASRGKSALHLPLHVTGPGQQGQRGTSPISRIPWPADAMQCSWQTGSLGGTHGVHCPLRSSGNRRSLLRVLDGQWSLNPASSSHISCRSTHIHQVSSMFHFLSLG